MARNPAAQTAFGPMVLAAVEQNEPPERRLVDDDLAELFLPAPLRWLVAATRFAPIRRLMIRGSEWSGPGLWANLACRKRFIADKLTESLADINAVVILGAGLDTRAYRLTRRVRIPVFEVDLPVNIAQKGQDGPAGAGRAAAVGSVGGAWILSVMTCSPRLAEHGYHTDYRAFFICEGVTQYLTEGGVRRTLEGLRAAAPGSRLVFTYVRRDFIDGTESLWHPDVVPQGPPAPTTVAFRSRARRCRRLHRRVRLAAGRAGRTGRTRRALRRAHRPQTQGVAAGMVGFRGKDLAEKFSAAIQISMTVGTIIGCRR